MWNTAKYHIEIICTVAGCLGYVVFHQKLVANAWFIVPLFFTLLVYVLLEFRFGDRSLDYFGIRKDNLMEATKWSFIVLGPILLSVSMYAFIKGVNHPVHFFYAVLLYPMYGIIQQFIFQGIFLNACRKVGLGYLSIVLTAVVFAIVHYPSTFMIKMTALGGLLFSTLFYFRPNIIPIGIFHGVFGAFLYYVLLNQDPMERFLDKL